MVFVPTSPAEKSNSFRNRSRSSIFMLLAVMTILGTHACKKDDGPKEIHCLSDSVTTKNGTHFTEFDDSYYFVKALDLEQELCLFSKNKIVIQSKSEMGSRVEIPISELMGVEVNDKDTILQTYYALYRFYPSTRQLELLHKTNYDWITNFSVIPGEGIVYFRAAKYGPSMDYFDFKKKTNKQIALAADLFPEIGYPYGQMEGFMKEGSPHVLLVYSQGGAANRSVGHVKVLNLSISMIIWQKFLPELSDIRLLKRNDHKTITILGDPFNPLNHRDIYLLDLWENKLDLKYRFENYSSNDDHWTNGSHLMNIDYGYDNISTVTLVNWETGKELFRVNFDDSAFRYAGRVFPVGEEYLICHSELSRTARIVGRDNCIHYFLKDTQAFDIILSATSEYVFALMEDGNVKRFDLKN